MIGLALKSRLMLSKANTAFSEGFKSKCVVFVVIKNIFKQKGISQKANKKRRIDLQIYTYFHIIAGFDCSLYPSCVEGRFL